MLSFTRLVGEGIGSAGHVGHAASPDVCPQEVLDGSYTHEPKFTLLSSPHLASLDQAARCPRVASHGAGSIAAADGLEADHRDRLQNGTWLAER